MSTVFNPLTSLFARFRATQRPLASPATAQRTPAPTSPIDATPAPATHHTQQPAPVRAARDRTRRRWTALSDELEAHARLGNWRSYRDTRLRMAHFLQQKGHPAQALELFLDVWYLDLNGPRDVHSATRRGRSASLLNEDPLFEPGRAPVPAGLKREVRRLVTSLSLRVETVQTIFLHVTGVTHRTHAPPLLPTQAWLIVGPELIR